ncbi:hypothetical protein KCP91_16655 [Microvirga sp. SRT01]|uniref:Uncharacterized protein n=1 Tax=Sphingomonas longa TaxID=2778730 RepID=A0ABS2DAP6_9SPHN|nr:MULTISPECIES: hypothetical protein [Alphaproteobacteria]MBM6578016.1 hypothetical protein [Sphingomonas sp. BT552]MBR7711057.1 hypothetical protein [Microvirga sp. SRT01]
MSVPLRARRWHRARPGSVLRQRRLDLVGRDAERAGQTAYRRAAFRQFAHAGDIHDRRVGPRITLFADDILATGRPVPLRRRLVRIARGRLLLLLPAFDPRLLASAQVGIAAGGTRLGLLCGKGGAILGAFLPRLCAFGRPILGAGVGADAEAARRRCAPALVHLAPDLVEPVVRVR